MWTAQAVRQHLAGASIQGGLEGAAPRLLGLCVKVKFKLSVDKYVAVIPLAVVICMYVCIIDMYCSYVWLMALVVCFLGFS